MNTYGSKRTSAGNGLLDHLTDKEVEQMRTIEALMYTNDPDLMRLPHPARCAYMKMVESAKLTYGTDWPLMSQAIADHTLTLFETVTVLKELSPTFRAMYYITGNDISGTNGGNSGNNVLSLRFLLNRGHVFQTTDVLDQQLQATDIADTIPISLVRAPFPVSYFEFGQSRQSPFTVYNELSGDHVAEGCYLFEGRSDRLKGKPHPEYRVLTLMLTGAPKDSITDDATRIYTIPVLDEDLPIADTIKTFMRHHREDIAQARSSNAGVILKESTDAEAEDLQRVLQHVMKILLYISTAKAVTETNNQRTAAMKKAQAAPAGRMRKKQEEKADRVYDHIIIGPKEFPKEEAEVRTGGSGRHVMPHWRRGHFREQRHGEGRKLVKTIFIQPMRIAFENIAEASLPSKTYIIKDI